MKIELKADESWQNERILVLPVDTVARKVDEYDILHIEFKTLTNEKNGKIVSIERLNDEYCAVSLADATR